MRIRPRDELREYSARIRLNNAAKGIPTSKAEMRAFIGTLRAMDAELEKEENTNGMSGRWSELWHDRMSFAANRYPGAPEPEAE